MHHGRFLFAGLFFILAFFTSTQLFAQEEIIEKRQKLMKSNSAANKAMKKAIEEKDYATVGAKAKDVMGNMDQIPGLFPKGSTSEKSKALPVIWEKWDDFTKGATKVKTAAKELADAVATKDEGNIVDKWKAYGKACGNCHKGFRKEVKKNGG